MERIDNLRNLDFEQMKSVDVRTVERENLTDISKIQINKNLPKDERFADFLGQVKNPYCYRCGKVVVKVSFADTGITLEERLEHYFESPPPNRRHQFRYSQCAQQTFIRSGATAGGRMRVYLGSLSG